MNCPHCNKKIAYVIEWNNTSIGYQLDLKTNICNYNDPIETDGDFYKHACPECGECIEVKFCKGVIIGLK